MIEQNGTRPKANAPGGHGITETDRARPVAIRSPYLIPSRRGDPTSETLPEDERELRRIFALPHNSSKVDFSRYKPTTVRRRVGRRMMVLRLNTVRDYARHIEHHPEELRDLYRDLLISVTSFFRDPASYRSLAKLISQMLGKREGKDEAVRVWVPGCATGEEVYPWRFASSNCWAKCT